MQPSHRRSVIAVISPALHVFTSRLRCGALSSWRSLKESLKSRCHRAETEAVSPSSRSFSPSGDVTVSCCGSLVCENIWSECVCVREQLRVHVHNDTTPLSPCQIFAI